MEPGAALRPPVAAVSIPCRVAGGRWHRSKEHSSSQRKLHRNQALAQLSKECFLRQGPQRSLSRFLTDPWGRDFTAGSLDGTTVQSTTVLYRAVGLDPVGIRDTNRVTLEWNPT